MQTSETEPAVMEWRANRMYFWMGLVGAVFFLGMLLGVTFGLPNDPDNDKALPGAIETIFIGSYVLYAPMLLFSLWLMGAGIWGRLRISPARIELRLRQQWHGIDTGKVRKLTWQLRMKRAVLSGEGQRVAVDFNLFKKEAEIVRRLHTMFAHCPQPGWERLAALQAHREKRRRPIGPIAPSDHTLLRWSLYLLPASVLVVNLAQVTRTSPWFYRMLTFEMLFGCAMAAMTTVLMSMWEIARYRANWRVACSLGLALLATAVATEPVWILLKDESLTEVVKETLKHRNDRG